MSRRKKKRKTGRRLLLGIFLILAAVLVIRLNTMRQGESLIPFLTTAKNLYDPKLFRQDGEFMRYGDGSLVGVDVSSHQGEIDWRQVADAGVEFAVIRAAYRGYTDGALTEDPQFRRNLTEAKNNGLRVGVYVFSQATTEAEAREEAQMALSCLDGSPLDLPVYFDWEVIEGVSRTETVSPGEPTAFAGVFCREVERAGYRGGVYFNQSLGYLTLDLSALEDHDLWLAQYRSLPGFLYHFDMWQYSPEGTVPGIDGNVDLNLRFPAEEDPDAGSCTSGSSGV